MVRGKEMKVIIVGLGSMGKRRLRLIQQLGRDIEIIGVDSNRSRIAEVEQLYKITCKESIEEAVKVGDAESAFVCTSPLSHKKVINELLENNLNVFTEINLVPDGYEELMRLAEKKNKVLFLSSTFLYRRDIQEITERVKNKRVNYIYHTGQYLPDWHPWENFKDFFVADVRTNGCREIMAIEFPWIINCFGKINNVYVTKDDTLSELELGYCDNYLLMLEHENGNKGVIAIDVVARKARRNLEVFNEKIQLFWNGTPQSLKYFDVETKELKTVETYSSIEKDTRYSENIIENAYSDEIIAFLHQVETMQTDMTLYDFEKDLYTLEWINKIEYGEE